MLEQITERKEIQSNLEISWAEMGTTRALMRLFGQTPPPLDLTIDKDDPRLDFVARMVRANEGDNGP